MHEYVQAGRSFSSPSGSRPWTTGTVKSMDGKRGFVRTATRAKNWRVGGRVGGVLGRLLVLGIGGDHACGWPETRKRGRTWEGSTDCVHVDVVERSEEVESIEIGACRSIEQWSSSQTTAINRRRAMDSGGATAGPGKTRAASCTSLV